MVERHRFERLAEIAGVLAEARVVRQALLQPEPAAESPAKHELSTAPEASVAAVKRLITSADLWTLVAADQLFGLSLLVRNGETVFSLFPILRSIVEHGASVAWILDDESDAHTRAARASLAALRSQEELAKAASRMGPSQTRGVSFGRSPAARPPTIPVPILLRASRQFRWRSQTVRREGRTTVQRHRRELGS
jgi:hypothetical protein